MASWDKDPQSIFALKQLVYITRDNLAAVTNVLVEGDRDLREIVEQYGAPPLWARAPGFSTLVHIILEQQVSLASAQAAHKKLQMAIAPVTPRRFLGLSATRLKAIGFSRQKITYARCLAQAIVAGEVNLAALQTVDDKTAHRTLTQVKGIGSWSADIYLLMALRRADIWPCGDLALAIAIQRVKRLKSRPDPQWLETLSQIWRPWRSVAARLLWHYYLNHKP
jgi:DNA-3-methyladenine glycosylase II